MMDLTKQADIQKIAIEGANIYEEIKDSYDPQEKGKFLAIDIDTKKTYIGSTSAEALEAARKSHPADTVFYIVKIGFDAAETMAKLFVG